MTYQDKWLKGKLVEKGTRECADRYKIIRDFCSEEYGPEPFTVCDIGANMCYFGIRLTEDFPDCHVIAFEFDSFAIREAHVKANGSDRLLLFRRKLSSTDIDSLSALCHFDVVLCLSVLHHAKNDWLDSVLRLGDNIIVEHAMEDSKRVKVNPSLKGSILGYGKSHLDDSVKRPIVLMKGAG
jgi:hypothetical protein